MILIPDIYHEITVKSWDEAAKSIPFIIFKATQGTSFVSPKLDEFITACENRGLSYWVYCFLNRGNELEQTKFMVSTCKNKVGKNFVGYVLDAEKNNELEDVKTALDWLNKNTQSKTMIYTMHYQYEKYKTLIDSRPEKCAWWEARYGKNDGTYNNNYPPHEGVDLHQFTEHGYISWIEDECDLSRITSARPVEWFMVQDTNKGGATEMTEKQAIEKLIATAEAEEGYIEKASNKMLDDKTANPGVNNYTKYWRDIDNWGMGDYQAQYWCAAFVYWCFVMTFGMANAKKLLYHEPYIYCPNAGNYFKEHNRLFSDPAVGDVVVFWKENKGRFGHTGIVYKVDSTYFYTIEGNTSTGAGVVSNGGAVVKKKYKISSAKSAGHKFCRPDYSIVATATTTTTPVTEKKTYNKTPKYFGTVTAEKLNVRTGVGTEYDTCSFSPLSKDAIVDICDSDKTSEGVTWYYIRYNGKYGFVSGKYIDKLTAKNKDDKLAGEYTTTANLHLRKGAGSSNESILIIPVGGTVTCYGDYEIVNGTKWYLVKYDTKNAIGYSSSKYLK